MHELKELKNNCMIQKFYWVPPTYWDRKKCPKYYYSRQYITLFASPHPEEGKFGQIYLPYKPE
jgi:hypothetical protein